MTPNTQVSMCDFNFFNKTDDIDFVLGSRDKRGLLSIFWKKSCENIIKRYFNFEKVLMSCNMNICLK